MSNQTRRKIGSESASLVSLTKEYFRKVFSGEWLKPDHSKLALLTPQERLQQREFLRKRIKFMIWGLMGMVAFGVPLFKRYFGSNEDRLKYKTATVLSNDTREVEQLKAEIEGLKQQLNDKKDVVDE
ncbi:hypothetical protein C9374_005636 [Naegleria lovaniensis]|uniref:Uncharacterized protein n=1 Tax=Naegleria lovaniensis TaxID=51637 RepID=A0AA88GNQ6_NAELO|nr:uncharacterized protein C9374_005636 [Naegleria lovaniensis]KAG2382434.1 hypothetical protein C9374_005636 [Naegleria lovaniensis]